MLEYINIACNINTRKTQNKVIYDEVIIQWHVFERYILYLDRQTRNEDVDAIDVEKESK